MSLLTDALEIRAKRKLESREQRTQANVIDYRDGYASGRGDYVMFLSAMDYSDTVGISPLNVKGYKAGYLDASKGRQDKFPGHPVPSYMGGTS